jgi:hypothetical protein
MYTYILNKGQKDTYIKDDLDTQKEKKTKKFSTTKRR